MYILFEEHQYEPKSVDKVLKGIFDLQDVSKKVSAQYVGYFYNPHVRDCVFILPKVLLRDISYKTEEGRTASSEVLAGLEGNIIPEDVMSPNGQERLPNEYRKFLYEFAVWIYRAISVYYKANPTSKAIYYKHIPQTARGLRQKTNTHLDVILGLIQFNRENQNFILYTIKNLHVGHNKINWTRTISHSQAYLQNGSPIYLEPVNKKRVVNYEEELFIIFYSILHYINETYGFHTPIDFHYDLITGKQFECYLNGLGCTRLKQIKYKYFSDKTLQLWDLCYAFFDKEHRVAVNMNNQEYLLAKSFNIIFEAMIDELIGDKNIPAGLKEQEDGKRIDHIYTDLALTSRDGDSRDVYYIGDSKYYKNGHILGSESVYKQYTYARNVIQWNVNLFLNDKDIDEEERKVRKADRDRFGNIHLQDAGVTEGYDVIPNFFISAFVYDDHKYKAKENIIKHTGKNEEHCTYISYQFPGRLFDRDTLILSHYDVNFLYVLYLYARNRSAEKAQWKEQVREKFRDEVRQVIEQKFDIFAMRSRLGVDGNLYIRDHFYELNGHVFQPYGPGYDAFYALALSPEKSEQSKILKSLENYFIIEPCKMGKDPTDVLHDKVETEFSKALKPSQWLSFHYLQKTPSDGVMFGYYHDEDHLRWILGKNDKGSLIYNVRLKVGKAESRDGAHSAIFYKNKKVRFVILYTDNFTETGEYRVFHVKDHAARVSGERMAKTWYPTTNRNNKPLGDYFFFRFDEEVNIARFDIRKAIEKAKLKLNDEQHSITSYEPLFLTCEELLEISNV